MMSRNIIEVKNLERGGLLYKMVKNELDSNFFGSWMKGFEKGLNFLDEENKICLLKQCAKSCADTGVLEKHQKLYEAVNHNRDEYYSRLNETGNVVGEVIIPDREYIITYPECGCDLHISCGLSSASLCECSRQSILYVEQSVTGENITVERLESILDGGKVCRFRIRIMINPWEEISLSDYENHMKLDSVMQLQNMNQMMKNQFDAYPASSVMILGIAGGNGLEHIDKKKFQKVYGVDINREYLTAVTERYSDISDILECIQLNLMEEADRLPKAELLVANLLIEYIGYVCFSKIAKQVQPQYISCIIQINIDDGWVSDSPYIHAFDNLDKVHHQIEEDSLIQTLNGMGYQLIKRIENPLPNEKKLLRLDFVYTREIDEEVSLVKYYPDYEMALEWYQDLEVCKQVDNRDEVYDLKLLKQMYQYLNQKGQLFYIEYQNRLCGDVCLQDSGEINIVISKPYQNKHIGRRVINEIIKIAKENNMKALQAEIYEFNYQSKKMFESVGFVKTDNDNYIFKL